MSEDPRLEEVRQRLVGPTSAEEVRNTLPLLGELSASPESAKGAREALRWAFQRLREFTDTEPERAVELLVRNLLPLCLVPDAADENVYGYRPSYAFGEWLADLPEEHRVRVRSEALPRAVDALGGSGVRNAIRLISSIGYWDDAILDALARLALTMDDETGDHALSARVALRSDIEPPLLKLYLGKLHARVPAGPNLHQIHSAQVIGNPETAELVWSHWLAPLSPPEPVRSMLTSFARSLLVKIAAREGNTAFTYRVWARLVELSRQQGGATEDVFAPNSTLVNELDIPEAVPVLVRLALSTEAQNHRFIYYLRVLECARPAHMAGWNVIAPDELLHVRHDAIAPTKMTGRSSTIELHRKEAAWDVLLCRGEPSLLPQLDDALAQENGYVANHFLTLAACLKLDPLPRTVYTLLAGSSEATGWDINERLVAQIGAIEAARGAGSREAFDALLGYQQVGEGVLLSLVEALAETAFNLVEGGDRAPVDKLLLTAETSPRDHSRGAAAAALAELIELGALTPNETTRLAALLKLPTTDPYARAEILFALATLPASNVPAAALAYARDVLAAALGEEPPDPRPAALSLLARQPGMIADAAFLERHLGLTDEGGTFLASKPTLTGSAPHVAGRYFVLEPERFASVVASLLRNGDAGVLAHVLPSVRQVGARTPPLVLGALVDRLKKADGGRVAEPALLHTLATVAPDRLLADGFPHVAAWLPQARADLADTLGGLGPLAEQLATARLEVLARLAGDGIYAVRRAAYRAAAQCDAERFIQLVVSWAGWREPGRVGPRRYAAECAGWLPTEVVAERLAQLGWDQEPSVRTAYERSLREREDRLAAAEFEERVLGVRDADGVIRNWRHGVGLSRVGDDSTIRRLNGRLREGLPPSVRFWLKRVRKTVEERWGAVTRKWPDPWFARPGNLENFAGRLMTDEGKETALAGTLWLMPAEAPGERSSWGGWARCEDRLMGDGNLLIPGRVSARVLVTSSVIPTYDVVFRGNGRYPDLA